MKHLLSMLFVAALAHLGTPATAELITWEDLIDETAQAYEDPYIGLVYDQLEDLRTIIVETARLDRGGLSEAEQSKSEWEISEADSRLAEQGIDADWLISQRWVVAERREKAATAVNANVDGETVTLGGFAIPAPPAADGSPVVYLVPERGMCSHMPPPNPNQMIRARLNTEWSPRMMHEPVRLTGKLIAEETSEVFRVVDGDMPMRASFVMHVSQVETMEDLFSDTNQSDAGTEGHSGRIRASSQMLSRQSTINK